MTQKFKRLLFMGLIACSAVDFVKAEDTDCCETTTCCEGCTQSNNLWQPHAFSVSISREILLQKPAWYNMNDHEGGWHGTFGVGFEYWGNFGEGSCQTSCCEGIGSMPFWASNGGNTLTIGSNDSGHDIDGYQLGLGALEAGGASNLGGTVSLSPDIYQTGADFFLYFGANQQERGFFAKIHGPIGVTSVNPGLFFSEGLTKQDYPAGAFSDSADPVAAPYDNIGLAFEGGKGAGDFYKPMKYGLISGCSRNSSAKFGDLAVAVGYNVYADECKHLGLALRFSAPTGNKAESIYALEPIFGRNGHWGAGGEILGHWKFWESDENDSCMTLWMDATAEHLFSSNHYRTFDLKNNGKGSKYLLLAKYSDAITDATFQNEIINAVNVTRLAVESTFDVELNFAMGLDYHWCNWNFMVGYEGWYRGCEELKLDCGCADSVNLSQYAVLGRQTPINSAAGNDLAQPTATIGKSEGRATAAPAAGSVIVDAKARSNRLSEDLVDAIDINGQRAHEAYTSKVFMQMAYTWKDSDYVPYLGVSGGAEFKHKDNSASDFWNVGVQGGLAF